MYTQKQLLSATLDDVLEEQYGALARWQARALGISDDTFDRRLKSGFLDPSHRGVAVASAWRHHELAPLAAAVLRGGAGAQLALWPADQLHRVDLRGDSELVHLWVPHRDRRPAPAPGLELRRSRHLTSHLDVTVRQRLPVTTVERSVIDRLARPMPRRDREGLLAELLQKGKTTEQRLRACAARHLEGAAQLRDLLGVVLGHDSGLEIELDRLARAAGVTCEPLVTVIDAEGRQTEVDLLVVRAGVVLEADGWAFHRDPAQREADELRDEWLRNLGLVVLRFTSGQVWEASEQSQQRIVAACSDRKWSPVGVTLRRQQQAAA